MLAREIATPGPEEAPSLRSLHYVCPSTSRTAHFGRDDRLDKYQLLGSVPRCGGILGKYEEAVEVLRGLVADIFG